jgi:hypothetical protein
MIDLSFTKAELTDLLKNLDQCLSKGYIDYGDPALDAYNKIAKAINKKPLTHCVKGVVTERLT